MAVDTRKIIEKLSRPVESPRGQMSIYWDLGLYRRFKQFCDSHKISASKMLEEFMRETMTETQPKKAHDKR